MELLMRITSGFFTADNTKVYKRKARTGCLRELCGKFFLFLFIFPLACCSSIVQKAGEVLEGTAFENTELALYRSSEDTSSEDTSAPKEKPPVTELKELILDNGEWILEITSSQWPGLALYGKFPRFDGSFELYGARVLSSHTNGWNEFNLDIAGKGIFTNYKSNGGLFSIVVPVQRVQISSGKIRLKDNRITGDAALTLLRNRRERILALTGWMDESRQTGLTDQSVFSDQVSEIPGFRNITEFDNYWKSRLMPELVSKKERPKDYITENAVWGSADSVNWNRTYTEALFPQELWEYRNSGALLRDWEEALPWIYMEYSWNAIMSSFNGVLLEKVK